MTCYRVAALLTGLLVRVAFRPQVRGVDRIPAADGFVISANHLSGFDSLAVAFVLGTRPVRSMAKDELVARPLLGRVIRLLGAFPAHGGGHVPGGVARAAELAAAGDIVLIFPEGTRRRGRRELRPKTGAARTALAAGVPLVPVALRGTDGWRRLRGWSIAVGDPIPVDELRADEPATAARRATQALWAAITELEATLDAGAGTGTGAASARGVSAIVAGGRS